MTSWLEIGSGLAIYSTGGQEFIFGFVVLLAVVYLLTIMRIGAAAGLTILFLIGFSLFTTINDPESMFYSPTNVVMLGMFLIVIFAVAAGSLGHYFWNRTR